MDMAVSALTAAIIRGLSLSDVLSARSGGESWCSGKDPGDKLRGLDSRSDSKILGELPKGRNGDRGRRREAGARGEDDVESVSGADRGVGVAEGDLRVLIVQPVSKYYRQAYSSHCQVVQVTLVEVRQGSFEVSGLQNYTNRMNVSRDGYWKPGRMNSRSSFVLFGFTERDQEQEVG